MEKQSKIYEYESFSATIDFAEFLGWEDTHGDSSSDNWNAEDVDACEDDALEFIMSKGYRVVGLGE